MNYEGVLPAQYDPQSVFPQTKRSSRAAVNKPALRNADAFDLLGAMDSVRIHGENTLGSGSGSGSGLSDLSAWENETDELGRRILQHQREVRRANTEARKPFFRARPRLRSTGLAERVQLDELENNIHQRSGSGGSADSDPPLNVPRDWGIRSRRRSDWLRKYETEGNGQAQPVIQPAGVDRIEENAIFLRRTVYTGHANPLFLPTDPDDPLPSVEDTPPSMRRRYRPQMSPTSSLRHMNSTLRPGLDSEEQDFTDVSLLASTPAVSSRHRKVDELMELELENGGGSQDFDVATLNQGSKRFADRIAETRIRTVPALEITRLSRRRRSLASDKENVPPVMDAKTATIGEGLPDTLVPTTHPVNFKNARRSRDSMDLLRRLARASSSSPDAPKYRTDTNETESKKGITTAVQYENGLFRGGRITSEAKPSAPEQFHEVENTPLPQEMDAEQKTPVVTGVWVDSPRRQAEKQKSLKDAGTEVGSTKPSTMTRKEPTDSNDGEANLIQSVPPQPKSALAAIVREAKAGTDLNIGESTIASLEDIVNPNLEPSNSTLTFESVLPAARPNDAGAPETQSEKDRRQEGLALENLAKHLRSTRINLKDVNRGLRRIENQVETAQAGDSPSKSSHIQRIYTDRNGRTVCDHCGGAFTSHWRALWVEFRENFYIWDDSSSFGLRPTWLGLVCLIWCVWYLIESSLCSVYCHKLYASKMIGYGVDPDAPIFPFVIPTLLLRPLKPLWEPFWEPASEYLSERFGDWFDLDYDDFHPALHPSYEAARSIRLGQARMPTLAARPTQSMRSLRTNFGDSAAWVAAAAAATSSLSSRVVHSVIDAVDEIGQMWDH